MNMYMYLPGNVKILFNSQFMASSRLYATLLDFSAYFDFFSRENPTKSVDFREFAPENPAKFCFFFRKISEALIRSQNVVILKEYNILLKLWKVWTQESFHK